MELKLIITLVIFSYLNQIALAYKFLIVPKNDYLIEPCPGLKDAYVTKYFDMSKLKFARSDSDENVVVANGFLKYLGGVPQNELIKLDLQFQKKVLGNWVNQMDIYREDVCKALFDQKEYWYQVTKNIKVENRICPPKIGKMPNFSMNFSLIADLPYRSFIGDYRALLSLKVKNGLMCLMVYGEVTEIS